MKKIAVLVASLLAFNAYADHGRGEWHGDYRGSGWLLPLIIGGVVGYSLEKQPPPAPVVVYPPYQYPVQPQPVFTEVLEYNAQCNCYVKVWRQTGWK